MIWTFWHNRMLGAVLGWRHFTPKHYAVVLTSPSKDGAIVAEVVGHFGIGNVRGSSSRRGGAAMLGLIAAIRSGADVAITPDGPRGPAYQLSPGVVKLAQATGAAVVPVFVHYSRYWELRSWDRFRIPKPFSKVEVIFDSLHEIPPEPEPAKGEEEGHSKSVLETERLRLETLLRNDCEGMVADGVSSVPV